METYKFTKLDNGDILLEKIIIDNINYTIVKLCNGNLLLKKYKYICITDIKDIKLYDFKKSIITECVIDNNFCSKLKYKSIIEQTYKLINNGATIIKNTKLNIITKKKDDEGFYYLDYIGISVQGADSNKCLLEIITQCTKNKIELSMIIKLLDDVTINIIF